MHFVDSRIEFWRASSPGLFALAGRNTDAELTQTYMPYPKGKANVEGCGWSLGKSFTWSRFQPLIAVVSGRLI